MIYCFYAALYISLLTGTVTLIGAAIYDMQQAAHAHRRSAHPFAAQYRHRPLVSIIIVARNDQNTILPCLQSIVSGTYRKFQVITINNASTDLTKKQLSEFRLHHPKLDFTFLSKRRSISYEQALLAGFKKTDGEIIVILKATDILDKNYLRNLTQDFATYPSIGVLTTNRLPIEYPSLIAVGQTYTYLAQTQFNKLSSIIHPLQSQLNSGDGFRSVVFKDFIKLRPSLKTRFSSNSSVYCQPRSYSNWLSGADHSTSSRSWLLLLPIAAAGAACFSLYLALSLRTATFLALSSLGVSLFLLLATWNSNLQLSRKLMLSLLLPIAFFLIGLILCLELFGWLIWIVRSIIKYSQIPWLSSTKSTV